MTTNNTELFDEYLNEEARNESFELPTIKQLEIMQNGKQDNVLTNKTMAQILLYIYRSESFPYFKKEDCLNAGYALSRTKEIGVYNIEFPDGSSIKSWQF